MKNIFRFLVTTSLMLLFCLQVLFPHPNNPSKGLPLATQNQHSEYFTQAENSRLKGNYDEAIDLFTKALSLARKNKDHKEEIESLRMLSLLHWNKGNLEDSLSFYSDALSLAEKAGFSDKKVEIEKYVKIHKLYQAGKDYRDDPTRAELQKSVDSFKEAITLAREIQSREHELKCLRQLSFTHEELGDIEEYFSLNTLALEIARQINHKREEGLCLFNIGYYYDAVEDYSQALRYYMDALILSRAQEDIDYVSLCLTNISNIYLELGDYDKALEYLREVLKIDQDQLKEEPFAEAYVAIDLNNIGITYQKRALQSGSAEDVQNALVNYQESLKIARRIQETGTEIEALTNIGFVYVDLERFSESLKFFEQALEKAEQVQDLDVTARILNNIGIVHAQQGNYDFSIEYLQKALKIATLTGKEEILWEAYFEIANAYMKKGDYYEALSNYKNSIDHLENIRSRIALEEFKASYLGTDKRLEAYENTIDLLFELSRLEPEKLYGSEAFLFLEKAKARAFLDRLKVSQVNITRGVDRDILDQEDRLMEEISSLNSELLKPDLSSEQEQNIRENLIQYEEQLENLKREIRISSPAYADLKYPQIISLEKTQDEMLDSKTAFFEYSIGEANSYAFVITKKNLKIFPLPPAETIRSQVKEYLGAVADRDNPDFRLGHTLFTTLVSPGMEENLEKIIFIPDDILHYLPFETLITQENSHHWLIKDYTIAYAPSVTSLREIIQHEEAREKNTQKDLLAFGDPYFGPDEEKTDTEGALKSGAEAKSSQFSRLEYSGLEIEKISRLFKNTEVNIFKRENATEARLKELDLDLYKILHLATHCIIDDNKPARSHIVFSVGSDSTEDEILQMREIFNLRLNSDLVTLSACQTGLGQLIKGEGIVGLSRSFFHAGASSAIISLWAVHDQATSQFMERYYYHLRASKSIMVALQKTKLEMIDSGVLSHPYYWAGFVVTGHADKTLYASNLKYVVYLGVFLLIVGVVIIMVLKRRVRSAS
jgi:CHAT domain-containing protein/Tfp pilus assembly protein PilF